MTFTIFTLGKASSICLGNFDGIHRAHQKILLACLDGAKRRNLVSLAFTFDPHPTKILNPKRAPLLLLLLRRSEKWLQKLGFDFILEQKFDRSFMKISAENFIKNVLKKNLHAKVIVIGPNFRFGFKAEGTAELLKKEKRF